MLYPTKQHQVIFPRGKLLQDQFGIESVLLNVQIWGKNQGYTLKEIIVTSPSGSSLSVYIHFHLSSYYLPSYLKLS